MLRVGIVGCGGIARAHVKAYKDTGQVELAAVCDISAEAAGKLADATGAKPYTDLDEMLDKERLDAVSLLTPPAVRWGPAGKIMDRGVHIFCEKPLAQTAAEARKMAEGAREKGVQLLVAQCHKFHEPVRRTRELIEDGTLGTIRTFRNRFGYGQKSDELVRGRGGILLDNGAHSSYLLRFLLGEPVRVFARGDRSDDITILRDCICIFETAENGIGVIELNGTVPKSKGIIEVYGTGGAAYIDYAGPSVFLPATENKEVPLTDPSLPPDHRFLREISHFLACVRGEEEPMIGADEGVRDVVILEACFESIRTNECVEIKSGG